jgi:UDP-N-acetylmuramoyl-tripeptide--D-alanyl-D-alanine ligase
VTAAVSTVVLTAALVARATDGRLMGRPDAVFAGVSTDTRAIRPGSLFVAIRGDRFDGHAFTREAVQGRAAGVLVSDPAAAVTDAPAIVVADTVVALQRLAQAVRRESRATVVAVTGSAGKTTTKEITADLLAPRFRVFRNRGNLNNHIGLPVSLVELASGPDVAVVELGMNHEGEIRTLVHIAEPEVRVWTNVGDAHIGYFGSREAIARAKAEILEGATPQTVVIANADDALVMRHVAGTPARVVSFGEHPGATVRAVSIVDRGFDGTSATIQTPAGVVHASLALPGRAHLMNAVAAVAVAADFGVPVADIERGLAAIRPMARRGASIALPSGARLIDDSYNASPVAVGAMVQTLAATTAAGRRIAVLGEMLELGDASRALHAACGRAVATAGLDVLVAIGGDAAEGLAEGAARAGFPLSHIHRFEDSRAAAPAVAALVAAGDVVLVKGSRGTRTDIVADRLQEVG